MNSCVSNSEYLANIDTYKRVFHIITVIEVPVHIYGAWCVMFNTPANMLSVKPFLLWTYFLSVTVDLAISFVSIPYVMLPSFSGYAFGVVGRADILVYVDLVLIAFVVMSIISAYENRYYILSARTKNPWWCKKRKYLLSFNYISAVLYVFPIFLSTPDQERAVGKVSEILSCTVEPYIDGRRLFVASLDFKIPFVCIVFESLLVAIEGFTFLILVIKKLMSRTRTPTLSVRTQSLQKKLVKAVVLQSTVPIFVIGIPVFGQMITTIFDYRNQNLTNLCVVIGSYHGVLSTLVLVFIHQPYRETTWNLLTFFCKRRKQLALNKKFAAVGVIKT